MARALLVVGVAGVIGFSWFVAVSWTVLSDALGLPGLLAVLTVVAVAVGTWAWLLVRTVRRPGRSVSRTGRSAVAAVWVLAAVTGVVAVPATRVRLEAGKCARLAAPAAEAQARCRDWLETRRQWWTLGLSHRNADH